MKIERTYLYIRYTVFKKDKRQLIRYQKMFKKNYISLASLAMPENGCLVNDVIYLLLVEIIGYHGQVVCTNL